MCELNCLQGGGDAPACAACFWWSGRAWVTSTGTRVLRVNYLSQRPMCMRLGSSVVAVRVGHWPSVTESGCDVVRVVRLCEWRWWYFFGGTGRCVGPVRARRSSSVS